MQDGAKLYVEELEARFELAVVAAAETDAEDGSCSGSCCIVGGNCDGDGSDTAA